MPTSTAHVLVGPLAQPGGINASFSTTYKSGGTTYNVAAGTQQSDQFTAVNQGMTTKAGIIAEQNDPQYYAQPVYFAICGC